jgi:hypothetical protein
MTPKSRPFSSSSARGGDSLTPPTSSRKYLSLGSKQFKDVPTDKGSSSSGDEGGSGKEGKEAMESPKSKESPK